MIFVSKIDVELDDYDNDDDENENNKSNIFNHGGRIEPGSMMTIDDDGQILQFSTTTTTIFPVKLKSNNQKTKHKIIWILSFYRFEI